MIIITSVGQETIDAINAGYKTNVDIAKYLSTETRRITSQNVGSRVARLRKQGLVSSMRKGTNPNEPLMYRLVDLPFVINDSLLKKRIPISDTPKTYTGMGENNLNCLNTYIYPKKLASQLNEITNDQHNRAVVDRTDEEEMDRQHIAV